MDKINIPTEKHDKTFVNGPINTFRLEGEIFGIKKVIYIFMDYHADIMNQTKCGNIKSLDFHEYLVKTFDELSGKQRNVDFFMEIVPTDLVNHPSIYKNIYISEVRQVFSEAFYYDPQKNVVGESNTFPNVRLHYLDVRDYFYFDIHDMFTSLFQINKLFLDNMDIIHDTMTLISAKVGSFQKELQKSTNDKSTNDKSTNDKNKIKNIPTIPKNIEALSKYNDEEIVGKMSEIVYKIKNKYKHPEIKKLIGQLIDNEILSRIKLFYNKQPDLQKLIDTSKIHLSNHPFHIFDKTSNDMDYGLPNKIHKSIDNDFSDLIAVCDGHIGDAYMMFTDLFFLRRFLDKDYVTNGIVYTGGYHSANYIYVLVKHFDFKITNCSTLMPEYTLDKLHGLIKKEKHPIDIRKYIFPEYRIQCSDLSDFPKHFK